MFTFETSVFVNRPQQEVYDFVSNPANDSQWQSGSVSAEWTSDGPVGIGSTQRAINRFLGRDIESTAEIKSWDPPNQYALKVVSGPIPFEATVNFESKDNGTQITYSGQAEAGGFFKLAEGLVGKQLNKQIELDANALKIVLENGAV